MRNFREYDIWQDSMKLVEHIYILVEKFPKKEQYVLVQQMTRCAISIPSNIAEGSAKESQKDFARFLGIALGSSYELETQILLATNLGYCDTNNETLDLLQSLQRRISGFIKKLKA
jgi:four helix bundle protein